MFVVVDGGVAGLVSVADPVKETTPAALRALHDLGFRIVMATGDNERTARAVAGWLGIDEIRAEVLPEDKARIHSRAAGPKAALSPWQATASTTPRRWQQADVGIAMGTGADVAIESAGFTLVKGDLNGILRTRKLSLATMRNIRQNLFFALVYNAAGVSVAAGILYPFLGISDLADLRGRGDEPVVGLGDRQRAAAAHGQPRHLNSNIGAAPLWLPRPCRSVELPKRSGDYSVSPCMKVSISSGVTPPSPLASMAANTRACTACISSRESAPSPSVSITISIIRIMPGPIIPGPIMSSQSPLCIR